MVILRDKTKGNLSKEEDDLLNGSIYELQLRYVDLSKWKPKLNDDQEIGPFGSIDELQLRYADLSKWSMRSY